MQSGPFREGEQVILIDPKARRYLVMLRAGDQFSSHLGQIPHAAIIGLAEGSRTVSNMETPFLVFRPTVADYILKMRRGAQVLYPKDIASVLVWGDIYPGATVLEAGAGSGALSLALLRAIGEKGLLITYEIREDFLRQARANVERYLGPVPNWRLRLRDVYDRVEDGPVDRAVLDVPEGWRAVPHVAKALRPGGLLTAFYPTVPQVQAMVSAIEAHPTLLVEEVFETILRTWNVQGQSVRPDHRMVAHTGFMITARRLSEGAKKSTPPPIPAETLPQEADAQVSAKAEDL
ncbi:MAG: tRNA (adenine-N1)-methyltransferase [Candidatus Methylomirabilales bacterium]